MLERVVEFALSQRLFVVVGVLLLIGAGAVLLPTLPIDAFPDVSPVQVKIIMKAPGLTPEEVEQRITVPIELESAWDPQQEDPALNNKIRDLPTLPSISTTAPTFTGLGTKFRSGCPMSCATCPME